MADCRLKFRKGRYQNLRGGFVVEFNIESVSIRGGRAIVSHEYPARNDHYTEDTGRKPYEYSVSAVIGGIGLRDKIDRIKRIFSADDGGLFYDAYANRTMKVRVKDFTIDESASDRDNVNFTLEMIDYGGEAAPSLIRKALSGILPLIETFDSILSTSYGTVMGVVTDFQALQESFDAAKAFFDLNFRRSGGGQIPQEIGRANASMAFDDVYAATQSAKVRDVNGFLRSQARGSWDTTPHEAAQMIAFNGSALSKYSARVIGSDFSQYDDARTQLTDLILTADYFQQYVSAIGLDDLAQATLDIRALAGGRVANETGDLDRVKLRNDRGHPFRISYDIFGKHTEAENIARLNNSPNGVILGPQVAYYQNWSQI